MSDIVTVEKFDEMNLKDKLLRGIYGYGFEKPSTIQQKSILPLIMGKDLIAQAQSGSGKTGAFCIGALEKIDININNVQVIILSHTKELARQTHNVFNELGDFLNIKTFII